MRSPTSNPVWPWVYRGRSSPPGRHRAGPPRRRAFYHPGLGAADQDRRMARGGVGDHGRVGLDDRSRHGGELPAGRPVGHARQFLEDAGGLEAGDGQGPPGVAQLRHVLGGGKTVSDHVADGQVGALARQGHRVVPVPADLLGRSGLPVAGPDIQAGNHRRRRGHDRALQDGGDRMLIGVHAGADQGLRDEVGGGGDEGELPRFELLRMPPHQADRADRRRARPQRPGQPARSLRKDRRAIRARVPLFILGGRPDNHRAAGPGRIGRRRGDLHRQVREPFADFLDVASRGDPGQPPAVLADEAEA